MVKAADKVEARPGRRTPGVSGGLRSFGAKGFPKKRGSQVKEGPELVKAVLLAAEQSGLTTDRSGRIGGRVDPKLVEQAKKRTGLKTNTDLINFALASVALEDDFAKAFREVSGTVDPELKLGF